MHVKNEKVRLVLIQNWKSTIFVKKYSYFENIDKLDNKVVVYTIKQNIKFVIISCFVNYCKLSEHILMWRQTKQIDQQCVSKLYKLHSNLAISMIDAFFA